MSITLLRALGVLAVGATLAACGTTDIERAATGAPIGAAIALATDNDPIEGAIIGAALGGISCSAAPGAPNCR